MNANDLNVFVINLKSSKDRREHMESVCSKVGLVPTFIEAVYGKKLSESELLTCYDKDKAIADFGRDLMLGEIGCALSHKKIYQKMVDEGIHVALILEDDATFEPLFKELLSQIDNYPNNWELILLGHYLGYVSHQEMLSPMSFWFRHRLQNNFFMGRLAGYGYGAHGYLINQEGARKLLNELEKIYRPLDHYTPDDSIINVYAVEPTVIKLQQSFYTLIDDENKRDDKEFYGWKKILKKTGLFSLVKYLYYFLKRLKPIKPFK